MHAQLNMHLLKQAELFWYFFQFMRSNMSKNDQSNYNLSSHSARIKKRSIINLQTKMELIQKYESGDRLVKLSRQYGIPESSIRSILRSSEKIKNSFATSSHVFQQNSSYTRPPIMQELENELVLFIEQQQIRSRLSKDIIREKAQSLFNKLKQPDTSFEFRASDGWYANFKKRYGIRWKHSKPKWKPSSPSPTNVEENESTSNVDSLPVKLSCDQLSDGIARMNQAIECFSSDIDQIRYSLFRRTCLDAMAVYTELLALKSNSESVPTRFVR